MIDTDHSGIEQSTIEKPANEVGKRIVGWTNNLIATSIVVVVALVVGRQLVALWIDQPDRSSQANGTSLAATPEDVAAIWPALSAASAAEIEFGDDAYHLLRQEVPMHGKSPADLLQQRCQSLLDEANGPVVAADDPLPSEIQLLDRLQWQQPIAEQPGRWRLWQQTSHATDTDTQGRLETEGSEGTVAPPILVGVRDDCLGARSSRLVMLGMALPGNSESTETTTLILFQKSGDRESKKLPIPPNCRRTIAIAPNGPGGAAGRSRLIGFQGGSMTSAKSFFNNWSHQHGWVANQPWIQTDNAQSQSFSGGQNLPNVETIRVELTVDAANKLRGLLIIKEAAAPHHQESTSR